MHTAAMPSRGSPCWIGAGSNTPLIEARLIQMSDKSATVALLDEADPPSVCNLLFTPDGKVGRRCELVWKMGDIIHLAVKEPLPGRFTSGDLTILLA